MIPAAEVRRLRSLRDKRCRQELGLFVVEGEKVVAELLSAGYRFEAIYATAAWQGERTAEMTEDEMGRASHFPKPSPVLAVGRIRSAPLPARALEQGLTLALDGVQDPGNVGTLLRIADWFALDRVLLSPGCADLHSAKVIQASMGSFARVSVHACDLVETLASAHVPILGCLLEGTDIHSFAAPRDAVIVIGSEGGGLSDEIRRLVTQPVTVPRYGGAESLNAAIAAAIVCDNVRRTRVKPAGA